MAFRARGSRHLGLVGGDVGADNLALERSLIGITPFEIALIRRRRRGALEGDELGNLLVRERGGELREPSGALRAVSRSGHTRACYGRWIRDIPPVPGRMVAFYSREVWHEVRPSHGERLALTLWIWAGHNEEDSDAE